jgi:hypothetical protein
MPYNPGINDQTGLIFAQGLANAGRGIGEGLAAMGARRDKELEERKRESDEFKALQQLAESAYGIPKNQTTALGLAQLRAEVRSKEIGRIQQEQKQRQEYTGLQMEQLRQSMAAKQQAAAREQGNVQALPGVLSSVRGRMQPAPMRFGGPAFQQQEAELPQLGQIAQQQAAAVGWGNPALLPGAMSAAQGQMQQLPAFQQRPMDLAGLAQIAQQRGYKFNPQDPVADLSALAKVAMPQADRRKVPELMKLGESELAFSPATGAFQVLPKPPTEKAMPQLSPTARINSRLTIMKQVTELMKEFDTATPARQRAIRNDLAKWNQQLSELEGGGEAAPVVAPVVGEGERVTVEDKNGMKFSLPAGQLKAAEAQGYKLVK